MRLAQFRTVGDFHMAFQRSLALVTGAAGGMAMACARRIGASHDLLLTDLVAERLEAQAQALREEGYIVAEAVAGDLSDPALLGRLVEAAQRRGGFDRLVHTAGLSPALAPWRPILSVNIVATARLLQAIDPLAGQGMVAVLIASIAGHAAPADPEADAILDDALADDLNGRLGPVLERLAGSGGDYEMASLAYALSKRAVMRLCQGYAPAWAAKGARIVSVSPGIIWTPMGRTEVDTNPAAAAVADATPMQRWGTAMDIANAVAFLSSDEASFITGTDLRVDGGVMPAQRRGNLPLAGM